MGNKQPFSSIQLPLKCHHVETVPPRRMRRGSATTSDKYVFVTPENSTEIYQYYTKKWMKLPSCPCSDPGLATIRGQLFAVGGKTNNKNTNKLFMFNSKQWNEHKSSMICARSSPAVITTSDGEYLIVIGGDGGVNITAELFQVKYETWHEIKSKIKISNVTKPSATICGDQLNVIGDDSNGYSCSLQALPSSDRPITSPLTLSWKPLPPLPVTESTAATLCGQLVIIGGRENWKQVKYIYQLINGVQWVRIDSTMHVCRAKCFVLGISEDKVLIVSGVSKQEMKDNAEVCEVVTTKTGTD